MMAGDALEVERNGRSASLDAVLARVQAELQATDEAGARLTVQLSRQALGAGDSVAALNLMNQALGKTASDTVAGTTASLSAAQAEARLAVAIGDRAAAIQILENELAQQVTRTNAVIRAEIQLAGIENQLVAANEKVAV